MLPFWDVRVGPVTPFGRYQFIGKIRLTAARGCLPTSTAPRGLCHRWPRDPDAQIPPNSESTLLFHHVRDLVPPSANSCKGDTVHTPLTFDRNVTLVWARRPVSSDPTAHSKWFTRTSSVDNRDKLRATRATAGCALNHRPRSPKLRDAFSLRRDTLLPYWALIKASTSYSYCRLMSGTYLIADGGPAALKQPLSTHKRHLLRFLGRQFVGQQTDYWLSNAFQEESCPARPLSFFIGLLRLPLPFLGPEFLRVS